MIPITVPIPPSCTHQLFVLTSHSRSKGKFDAFWSLAGQAIGETRYYHFIRISLPTCTKIKICIFGSYLNISRFLIPVIVKSRFFWNRSRIGKYGSLRILRWRSEKTYRRASNIFALSPQLCHELFSVRDYLFVFVLVLLVLLLPFPFWFSLLLLIDRTTTCF